MSLSSMLAFTLRNSHSVGFDPDGPFPSLFRILTVRSPSVQTLDLSEFAGHTILITGGTSGCGFECARALSLVGCHLILTTRSQERGEAAKKQIESQVQSVNAQTTVDMVELDMTSLQSVKSLPLRLEKLAVQVDIAILNAGVYQTEFHLCPETGWEEILQVNFLSTAALVMLLRPRLSRAESGRLLVVSSEAHAWADPHHGSTQELLDRLNKPDCPMYPSYQRYHISKLILNLWVNEISGREDWSKVFLATVSPGYSRTKLFREFDNSAIVRAMERIVCRTSEQSATQYIYALQDMARGRERGGFWSDGRWRKPSAAMSSTIGVEIQKSVDENVMAILQDAGVVE